MEPHDVTRKLAAILSADVVGYSRLMQADERAALEMLKACRAAIQRAVEQHGGRIVNAPGDAVLAEFPSAVEAVRCAAEIQQDFKNSNSALPAEQRMDYRIGVNLGEVIEETDGTLYGDGVNIAARLEGLAEAGGVCLSGKVFDEVERRLDIPFDYVGEHAVKNIAKPIRVYRLRGEAATAPYQAALSLGPLVFRFHRKRTRRMVLAFVATGMISAITGGALYLWPHRKDGIRPGTAGPNRLAVLPFRNISADPNDEYFADGMTEELISRLSRISRLEVIARTSVMKYKGAEKSITEIGRELDVGNVLEGSVRKVEKRVRVTVQLISVGNQAHLWSEDYDRNLQDVIAIQSEIAQRVADALSVRLQAGERQQIENKGTQNLEAYELYLAGLYHFNKMTNDELMKSKAYFEQALEKDPTYAQAYTWFAMSCDTLVFYGILPAKEVLPKSKAAVTRALELDDTIAETHSELALVRTYSDWDWPRAERGYQRALSLNPNSALVHEVYGICCLSPLGRGDEAIAELRRALQLDPLSTLYRHDLGWILNHMYRYDEAIEQFQKVLEMEPDFSNAHRGLGLAYAQKGLYDKAVREMQKEVDLTGHGTYAMAHLGWAYGVSGRRNEALRTLQALKDRERHERIDPLAFAHIYAGLAQMDPAFEWLQKGCEEPSMDILWLAVDAIWAPLRPDPRFTPLLKKIGLVK